MAMGLEYGGPPSLGPLGGEPWATVIWGLQKMYSAISKETSTERGL